MTETIIIILNSLILLVVILNYIQTIKMTEKVERMPQTLTDSRVKRIYNHIFPKPKKPTEKTND